MKINLGSSKLKKSFFPNSFDSSTTLNFGEIIPTFCKEVVPDSNVNIDVRSGVRFAPLTLPTFGAAFLKNYYFYNKFSDIYPPFNNLLTQTPYVNGSSGMDYIPTNVPNVPLSFLWAMVLTNAQYTLYFQNDGQIMSSSNNPVSLATFNLSKADLGDWTGLTNDVLAATILMNGRGINTSKLTSASLSLYSPVFGHNTTTFDIPDEDSLEQFDYLVPNIQAKTDAPGDFWQFQGSYVKFPTPSSANGFYTIGVRLNDTGKLLRKILVGLGYKIGNYSTRVSILPLIAYFYNYFDTFAPKRFIQKINTAAYKIMNIVVNENRTFEDVFYTTKLGAPNQLGVQFVDDLASCFYTEDTDYYTSQIIGQVNNFGKEISRKYLGHNYCDDEVQLQTVTGGNSSTAYFGFNDIDFRTPDNTNVANAHQQSQQNILSRLTEFLNIRSLVGGKIADTLESIFGIKKKDVLNGDNPYIGSSSIEVQCSDVFSTAETQQGSLGEYAGKAVAGGNNGNFNVDCSAHGIVMCFSTIVPRTQYVDGVDPCLFHNEYSDFYNPKFDGLTLLPTRALSLYAHDSLGNYGSRSDNVDSHSFGNSPIYSEYKIKTQGVLNGDLSLRSTQSSYDSFTMDKSIANEPYSSSVNGGVITARVAIGSPLYMTAGTMWRYIGRWLWYGRFDRIFLQTRDSVYDWPYDGFTTRNINRTDDNMIVHNIVDLKINAPMLPMADSFMTKDLYELENGVGVRSQGE